MQVNAKQERFLKQYEPVHSQFERFCRARVYGHMEYTDLMNETLLIAYQKIDELQSEKAFLSFLIGISIRILANHHRKRREEALNEVTTQLLDEGNNPEKDTEVYLLHQALAQLPEEQRECLILFEISGFSIKEIMEIQKAGESAVKQRLKRGRAKLTEIITFESQYKKEVENGAN